MWYKGYHFSDENNDPGGETSWHFDNGNFFAIGNHGVQNEVGTNEDGEQVHFVHYREDSTGAQFAGWWFQFVLAAVASAIVGGALAERAQVSAYLLVTLAMTTFIYPVVAHWVWDAYGWASAFNAYGPDGAFLGGCIDFGGAGVVHMTGGIAALCGAKIIGPRAGRFDAAGKPLPIPGHSTALQVLGAFFLWIGWYGANFGNTLGMSSAAAAQTAARVVATTTLSAAAGGLTVVLVDSSKMGKGAWDIREMCNGVLAGLVSITAGCAVVTTWAAVVIGLLGGLVYFGTSRLVLHKLRIDDPLDAFAVHGACGFFSVFITGVLASPDYTQHYYSWTAHQNKDYTWDHKYSGIVYGGTHLLGAQMCALAAVAGWVGFMATLLFLALKFAKLLRVTAAVESAGIDSTTYVKTAIEADASATERGRLLQERLPPTTGRA